MPTSAGTSNASSERMNTSMVTASTAGSDRRNVTLRNTCQPPAPDMRAASSRSGLKFRSVAPISRNTIGDQSRPSMKIMHGML